MDANLLFDDIKIDDKNILQKDDKNINDLDLELNNVLKKFPLLFIDKVNLIL